MHPAFREGFEKSASLVGEVIGRPLASAIKGGFKGVTYPVRHPINTMKGMGKMTKNVKEGLVGGPVAKGFTALSVLGAAGQAMDAAKPSTGLTGVKL